MTRLLVLPVLLITLLLGTPASAADYQKGLDAWNKKDYATALREFRPFAEQGLADAQYLLGDMYEEGEGVIEDYALAHMWWNIAASQGKEVAKKNRDRVEKEMSPTQIETAHKLARECVKKNYKG